MHIMQTMIGEHQIVIRTASENIRRWILGTYDIRGHPFEAHQDGQGDLSVLIEDGYGEPFKNFDVQVKTANGFVQYCRSDYFIHFKRGYRFAEVKVYDQFAFNHALLNLYNSFIIFHEWGVLLHASCVVEGGKAYAFASTSLAGKLAVTRLSAQRLILADEITLIRIGPDGSRVFDSPFRSDIKSHFHRRSYDLEGIYLLQQSEQTKQILLHKPDGLLHVLNHLYFWSDDQTETNKVLTMGKRLVEQCKISRLFFQENNKYWEKIVW